VFLSFPRPEPCNDGAHPVQSEKDLRVLKYGDENGNHVAFHCEATPPPPPQADLREAVRERPELRSTFLSVRAAEDFLARRIADPRDRERFLELVRGAIASSIHRGEPLPSVSLRASPERKTLNNSKTADPEREDPTR
jgi:hypothetical protein